MRLRAAGTADSGRSRLGALVVLLFVLSYRLHLVQAHRTHMFTAVHPRVTTYLVQTAVYTRVSTVPVAHGILHILVYTATVRWWPLGRTIYDSIYTTVVTM